MWDCSTKTLIHKVFLRDRCYERKHKHTIDAEKETEDTDIFLLTQKNQLWPEQNPTGFFCVPEQLSYAAVVVLLVFPQSHFWVKWPISSQKFVRNQKQYPPK